MKLATFNVNSLKARLPIVLDWLAAQQPDVLCLQEIKGMDIPEMELKGAGYHIYADTQKAYNGVMTLSRTEMNVVATRLPGFADDEQARFLVTSLSSRTARRADPGSSSVFVVEGPGSRRLRGLARDDTSVVFINIYAPNGNPIGTDKYTYKLRWLNALYDYLKDLRAQGRDAVVMGDFNIIPEPEDAARPDDWRGDALFQDEVRALYRALLFLGFADALRTCHPGRPQGDPGPSVANTDEGPGSPLRVGRDDNLYTFWDYQAGAWPRNNGIRIDHVLLTPRLADRLVAAAVDRTPRALERPSDHTPVVVEIDEPMSR